jgi:hypothetical protein
MKVTTFIDTIRGYAPDGFRFWSGLYRGDYNQEKEIDNVMLLVLPRTWPSLWHDGCSRRITFSLWFGVTRDIMEGRISVNDREKYNDAGLLSAVHEVAIETLQAIGADTNISIVNDPAMSYFDAADGQAVNMQAWLEVPVEADIWAMTGEVEYLIDTYLR